MAEVKLVAPRSYVEATPEMRAELTNGCGPEGILNHIISDRIWFLDISEACRIHDWMYYWGEDLAAKKLADETFHDNMIRLIDGMTSWPWLRRKRYERAQKYYVAVRNFGGPAFWHNKHLPVLGYQILEEIT